MVPTSDECTQVSPIFQRAVSRSASRSTRGLSRSGHFPLVRVGGGGGGARAGCEGRAFGQELHLPRVVGAEGATNAPSYPNATMCSPVVTKPILSMRPPQVLLDVLHPGSGRRAGRWPTAPRAASSRAAVSGEGESHYPIAIGSHDDARFVTVSRDVGSRAGGARTSTRARSTASARLPRPHTP